MIFRYIALITLFIYYQTEAQSLYPVTPATNLDSVISILQPGDTVSFEAGIYFGPVKLLNVYGELDKPVVFIGPEEITNSAVIDGRRPSPNVATTYNWLEITGSSWIEFVNLHFQNAWIDPIPVDNSSYISFKKCYFQGGRRLINVKGAESHHILVENCFWDQGANYAWKVNSWADGDAWESMHHGKLSFLNGSLFTSQGTSGSHVLRGNTIQNAFNGLRWRGDEGFDANIEIYQNTFKHIRDNDFEPEDYTKNMFIHHNWSHNIHKTLSIDHVNGGNIYFFGNTITNDPDNWSEDICTGYYKIYGQPEDNVTAPIYIFNNSYYGSGRLHGSIGDREMRYVRHFNNAYHLTKRRWELDQWNETLQYDYDLTNKSFSGVLTNNNQEQNGIVADPLYTSIENLDLTLQDDSPAIDAGGIISIPELNWTMTYQGAAPDIGAYDQNQPIYGPFFRIDTLAISEPVPENPRITQLRYLNDSAFLSFSYPIRESSVEGNILVSGKSGESLTVSDFKMYDNDYTIGFVSGFDIQEVNIQGPLLGINGLSATNWANAAGFEKIVHEDVVVYMLHPQLEPRVPPPPSGVYINGNLMRSIVPKGTEIVIEASADEGFVFDRWEGDLTGKDTIVTMSLEKSSWIIGHFERVEDDEDGDNKDNDKTIVNNQETHFIIYPNPGTGMFYINGIRDATVKIQAIDGKSYIREMNGGELDLRFLSNGLYMIEFVGNRDIAPLKIMIQQHVFR